MILKNIDITRVDYGSDKGEYKCRVSYQGSYNDTSLNLPKETTELILNVVADLIVESSKEIANKITAEVINQEKGLPAPEVIDE